MNSLELLILSNLINNKNYFNEVINHIKPEFFEGEIKTIIGLIKRYAIDYQNQPSAAVLKISIDNLTTENQESYNKLVSTLKSAVKPLEDDNYKWLVDETEKYCKHKAVKNALFESVNILKNKDKIDDSILGLLEDALSVTFNDTVGYNYLDKTEERLNSYKEQVEKFPIHLTMINNITNGGVKPKTLNAIMGGCVIPSTLIKIRLKKKK